MNRDIDSGVMGLLLNSHSHSSFKGKKYFFKGDLYQMSKAQDAARRLGIETDCEGGCPFAMSEEDFKKVKEYLISNRIDGWWHYVSNEEYKKLKGRD